MKNAPVTTYTASTWVSRSDIYTPYLIRRYDMLCTFISFATTQVDRIRTAHSAPIKTSKLHTPDYHARPRNTYNAISNTFNFKIMRLQLTNSPTPPIHRFLSQKPEHAVTMVARAFTLPPSIVVNVQQGSPDRRGPHLSWWLDRNFVM